MAYLHPSQRLNTFHPPSSPVAPSRPGEDLMPEILKQCNEWTNKQVQAHGGAKASKAMYEGAKRSNGWALRDAAITRWNEDGRLEKSWVAWCVFFLSWSSIWGWTLKHPTRNTLCSFCKGYIIFVMLSSLWPDVSNLSLDSHVQLWKWSPRSHNSFKLESIPVYLTKERQWVCKRNYTVSFLFDGF